MARAEGIKVAVERAIHDALRESIQRIADQHGIKVHDVNVVWYTSVPMAGKPSHFVTAISARTESVHP